jgi:hypothetical protein
VADLRPGRGPGRGVFAVAGTKEGTEGRHGQPLEGSPLATGGGGGPSAEVRELCLEEERGSTSAPVEVHADRPRRNRGL